MAVNRIMMIQILEDSGRRPSLAIQYLPACGVFLFQIVDEFSGVRYSDDQNSGY